LAASATVEVDVEVEVEVDVESEEAVQPEASDESVGAVRSVGAMDPGESEESLAWENPEIERPLCPVPYERLIDGLFGALTWFETAYEKICERTEMEMFTRHEFVLLRMIGRFAENMRSAGPTELAKALGMSKGYVSKLSRSLIAEGVIERQQHRADARLYVYDLTPWGESTADPSNLGLALWELMIDELGPRSAHELACALLHLERRPEY
jgi:DNA-binding MarR family transcriptional regulator